MKAILLSLVFLFGLNIYVFSQFSKGNIFMGSNLNLYSITSEKQMDANNYNIGKDTLNGFAISPQIGVFVSSNIAMGLGLTYEYEKEGFKATGASYSLQIRSKLYSLDVFTRTYKSINENMALFIHTFIDFGRGSFKETLYNNYSQNYKINGKYKSYQFGISPGFNFFLGNKISLEAKFGFIGYQSQKEIYDIDGTEKINTQKGLMFDFNISTLTLGINYFLNRKTKPNI